MDSFVTIFSAIKVRSSSMILVTGYKRSKLSQNFIRHPKFRFYPSREEFRAALPGLVFVVFPIILMSEGLYWLESSYVRQIYHVPAPVISLMVAAVISMVVTNLIRVPPRFSEGLQFTTKWLLKVGIVLYGLNFSYRLWFKPGADWILLIGVVAVVIPMFAAYFLGKLVHLSEQSSLLVAVGTGICGISAIVATQQALKSDEESAGMSLATILVFGTLVLFVYPVLARTLSLSTTVYGIWTGATTLDLPQLVAAALQGGGEESLLAGLWVKSIRIGLLVPVILILVARFMKIGASQVGVERLKYRQVLCSFPLFILAFFFMILYNTLLPPPGWLVSPIATGSGEFLGINLANLLLTSAIVGICFRVRKDVIGKTGWKILIVGGLAWALQSVLVFWLASTLPIPAV